MKKSLITFMTVLVLCQVTKGEGYQVNTLSARQLGMGHTGVAMKLGAESMFFNPAGLASMQNTVDITGSFTSIFAKASCTPEGGKKYSTVSDPSTPLMVNAAFSIYDNLKAGVSFYTPYGSGIDWTDNWPGAVLSQRVSLKVFTVQPTVGWQIMPRLSIGAGMTINWGNVDLSKGLVVPTTADMMVGLLAQQGIIQDPTFYNGTMPVSISLKGKSNVSIGYNVGITYSPLKNLTLGASFRSKVKMSVDAGDASLSFANLQAQAILKELNVINNTNFAASMPCPYVFSVGASWKPAERWEVAVDWRLTGWNAYKSLDIRFLDDLCSDYNQNLEKNYSNSWALSVGARYMVTKRFNVSAGLMYDTTPVKKDLYNPETPGMTKIEPTLGFSFTPLKGFSIDVAAMYVAGLGRNDCSYTYKDMLAEKLNLLLPSDKALPEWKTFTADYRASAFIASVGLRYAF